MWPWGHAAVGYLLYEGYRYVRVGARPRSWPVLALVFGTQFPDLIDKPLAWQFHAIPNGRSLAHSAFTAALVVAVLWVIASRTNREALVVAFGIGYWSHLFADALYPALAGNWYYVSFLAWPAVPPIDYGGHPGGFVANVLAHHPGPTAVFEAGLFALATALWIRDGTPGLELFVPGRRTRAADEPE